MNFFDDELIQTAAGRLDQAMSRIDVAKKLMAFLLESVAGVGWF
jgi:hypothetical protein